MVSLGLSAQLDALQALVEGTAVGVLKEAVRLGRIDVPDPVCATLAKRIALRARQDLASTYVAVAQNAKGSA